MKSSIKILFTSTFMTPFINSDLQFLQKNYKVDSVTESGLTALLKYLREIKKTDITFSWFASTYASFLIFLTKIWGKKSVLVLGGVDVAKEKEINYGIWNSNWKSLLVSYAIKNADRVLAVDESIKKDAISLCNYNGENIIVLPTGYNPDYWKANGDKQDFVLTVATCPDIKRIRIKGIDFLLEVAKKTKEVKFIIIGIDDLLLSELSLSRNIKTIKVIPQEELLSYYQKAKVYFQPSYREGLPNSLCEAMLCECFPVGTRVGGIPIAIGDTGITIDYGSIDEASAAIRNALEQGDGKKARKRMKENFNLMKREEELNSIIASLKL